MYIDHFIGSEELRMEDTPDSVGKNPKTLINLFFPTEDISLTLAEPGELADAF